MRITVKGGTLQKKYLGGRPAVLDLPEESDALAAAIAAGIPESEIGIITMNARKIDSSTALSEGDTIEVFPVIIGG